MLSSRLGGQHSHTPHPDFDERCPGPTCPQHGFLAGKPIAMWLTRVFPQLRAGEQTAALV